MNSKFDADLTLPEEFHSSMNLVNTATDLENLSIQYLTEERLIQIEKLHQDINTFGFDRAINNYESLILESSITQEEFNEQNLFLNSIKVLYDVNYSSNLTSARMSCFWASVVFAAAFVSLASCATGLACSLATIGYISAGANLAEACG